MKENKNKEYIYINNTPKSEKIRKKKTTAAINSLYSELATESCLRRPEERGSLIALPPWMAAPWSSVGDGTKIGGKSNASKQKHGGRGAIFFNIGATSLELRILGFIALDLLRRRRRLRRLNLLVLPSQCFFHFRHHFLKNWQIEKKGSLKLQN